MTLSCGFNIWATPHWCFHTASSSPSSQFWSPNFEFQHPAPAHGGGRYFRLSRSSDTYCSALPLSCCHKSTGCILLSCLKLPFYPVSCLISPPQKDLSVSRTFILSTALPRGTGSVLIFRLPSYRWRFSFPFSSLIFCQCLVGTLMNCSTHRCIFQYLGEKVQLLSY